MTYTPLLNPKRGFIIERAQPLTKQDVDLVKLVLEENDEVIIGVGNAGYSHEPGNLMTAGERVDLIDYVLTAEGIDSNRYIIVPIESSPEPTQWVAEVMMMTPRWQAFYTRNFKNSSMFASFQRQYGYHSKNIDEQKPDKDYFELLTRKLNGDRLASKELDLYLPPAAIQRMEELRINERARVIYNRENVTFEPALNTKKRALFLGGLQPLTGVYEDNNGHLNPIRLGLEKRDQVVIAIGSAQESLKDSDPLTAGQRIEMVRYALSSNGINSSRYYIVPIKDIPANACFASKVISLCPEFDSVIAGNDWTKEIFGESNYSILPIPRSSAKGTDLPISATKVRNITFDILSKNHPKGENISSSTITQIEVALKNMIDPATLAILRDIRYYQIMHFLVNAKE